MTKKSCGTAAAPFRILRPVAQSPWSPSRPLSQVALQRPRPAHMPQAGQRLLLDLPHPLAGDAQEGADFLEGHRLAAVQPEVQAQDLRLALLEMGERFLDRLGERLLERLLVGCRIERVGEVVEELVVFAR